MCDSFNGLGVVNAEWNCLFSASAWSIGFVFVIPFTFSGETPTFSLFWGFFMNDQGFLLGLLSANLLFSIIMFSI